MSNNNRIIPYAGEFLVSPAATEMSLNWCSHDCSYCIEENSPVMLANLRTKPGKDVQVGDVLLGFTRTEGQKCREWAPAVVEEIFSREVPGVRVYLANGETITCTPDHHFYTGREKNEYAPICTQGPYSKAVVRQGRALHRIRLPLLPSEPFTDDYRRGYIRGLLEGDASTTPYGAWRIALSDPEPLQRVADFARDLGWDVPQEREFKHYGEGTSDRSPMRQLYFPVAHPVASSLMATSDEAAPAEYWRGWLAGIYDAEGNTPARRGNHQQGALRIAQYQSVNPGTYDRICAALDLFGFHYVQESKGLRLINSGGLAAPAFVQLVEPAILRKAQILTGRTLKGLQERVPVIRVEDAGLIRVASFRTSTHNYVSGGYLSRNCFANLNQPNRRADYKGIMGLLADYRNRDTPEALYLQQGYPTLISNRVDPFAKSNSRLVMPILETMAELGLPMAFQTKGGDGVSEALEFLPPSVWYVSLSFWDDAIRQRIEPAAPSIAERLELLEKLRDKGHVVTVGVNPCDPDWLPWPDAERLLDALAERDVWGCWMEPLHFNREQVSRLEPAAIAAMGESVVERANRRTSSPFAMEYVRRVYNAAAERGMEPYCNMIDGPTGFFAPWYELYPKAMPTWQLLMNACFDAEVQPNELISFDAAMELFAPHLPDGEMNYYYVLGYERYQVCRDIMAARGDRRHVFNQAETLAAIWGDRRITMGPTAMACFAYACEREGENGKEIYPVVDEQGRPYLQFNPDGWQYYFSDGLAPSGNC